MCSPEAQGKRPAEGGENNAEKKPRLGPVEASGLLGPKLCLDPKP